MNVNEAFRVGLLKRQGKDEERVRMRIKSIRYDVHAKLLQDCNTCKVQMLQLRMLFLLLLDGDHSKEYHTMMS